jgi:hypothetical protein
MNCFGFAVLFFGFGAYLLGLHFARKPMPRRLASLIVVAIILLAMPAIVYAFYYSKLLGEPVWLYCVRTVPGSEFLASLAWFSAGWAQVRAVPHLQLSADGKRFLMPVMLGFTLVLPYLKPLLRPLSAASWREHWKGEACLQSTFSTCGPASAATIVRRLGGRLLERDLAKEAFTCKSGTENWYLARVRKLHPSFPIDSVGYPFIASIAWVDYPFAFSWQFVLFVSFVIPPCTCCAFLVSGKRKPHVQSVTVCGGGRTESGRG